jgi:hypothetical protein
VGEGVSSQSRQALLKQFAPQHHKASSVQKRVLLDASELRPRPKVEATSYDILAVNQNIYIRSETLPFLLLAHMFINWLSLML